MVDSLRKALKPYQTLLDTVDKLEELGKLEQAEAETLDRLRAAQLQETELQARKEALSSELGKAEAEVAAVRRDAAAILSEAQGAARRVTDEAEQAKAGVLAGARAEADGFVRAAERVRDQLRAEIATLKDERTGLETEINRFAARLAALKAEAAAQLGLRVG
jgi:predicted  nucleic acid-binding Zn-ribbon protein